MFAGRYFLKRHFAGRYFPPSGEGGTPATGFGRLEYTVTRSQMEFTLADERVEFTLDDERVEYSGAEN